MNDVDEALPPKYLSWHIGRLCLGHLSRGRGSTHNCHVQFKLCVIKLSSIVEVMQWATLIDDMAHNVGPDDDLLSISLQLQLRMRLN